MAENWGPGVSRTLSALARQFTNVVWQADKPPLDSELNLMSQIEWESLSNVVRSQVHSGFFLDPTRAREDYEVDPLWTNQFAIGVPAVVDLIEEAEPVLIAAVNGWVFPVAGTQIDSVKNRIALYPPPSTDARTDFVFLEVWRTIVAPNPSTVNKPTAATIWKYGNVEFGGTNITDDIEDPSIGFETTERVQLQYRIRVVGSGDGLGTSIDLSNYPDGLDDPQIRAQGTATSPVLAYQFDNMRQELGDPSLWRAGDGNYLNGLGTIDGYVYAIPIAGIFRRNTSPFVAVTSSGNPNQNGSTDRTPSSKSLPDPRNGARALAQAVLAADITSTQTGPIVLVNLVDSALADPDLFPTGVTTRFLVLGSGINREIIAFTGTDAVSTIFVPTPAPGVNSGRGRNGTMARPHLAGTTVVLYDSRPDGLYADQIVRDDLVDLRRAVNFGDWDYTRILQHAVASIAQGTLKTAFKKAGTGADTFGVVTTEVSYLWGVNTSPPPNHTEQIDGPDGIRTIWSDSAALQPDVTIMVDPNAPTTNGFADTTFSSSVADNWSVGADFQPSGFLNNPTTDGWTNGSVILIHLGGSSGTDGARAGFPQSPNPQAVRQVSPVEMWLSDGSVNLGEQHPWKLRFEGGPTSATPVLPATTPIANAFSAARITTPAVIGEPTLQHPGPMFPLRDQNFERPFIVLGGILNPALAFTTIPSTSTNFINPIVPDTRYQIRVPGLNFDTFVLPLLRGALTLRDMLTDGNRDRTGASSLVYVAVYGNALSRDNNGAFKVVGAGTASATGGAYTDQLADAADQMVVEPLSADFAAFTHDPTQTVILEFRSQTINAEDDKGRVTGPAGVALVFTDIANIEGGSGNPWNSANTGTLAVQQTGLPAKLIPVNSKAVITSTLMWHPTRGASTRVPDKMIRFSARASAATFLRNVPSVIDPEFSTLAPFPAGERLYDGTHIQLWNRLTSLGEFEPQAPAYGGFVVGRSEQDREHELFFDMGSKSIIFRPFILKNMTFKALTTGATPSLLGPVAYLDAALKDGAAIFTTGLQMGFPVPPEYVPRFGRQDIPYHLRTSTVDPFMPGINHLFCDETDDTAEVFWIIGGEDNGGSPAANRVNPILFTTDVATIPYGHRGTVGGPPHPAYGGRKQFYADVVSSDLGVGLNGIELPPYLGIARLYGVYEKADFLAHLDPTYIGSFQADRLTPIVNPPVNLLRTGATQQTLFIRQGGGNDVTGTANAHTYLVPDSAIDISLIPTFINGNIFTSFDYVVECVVFGFGEGWINQNNFVLARRNTGTGADVTDGSNPELVDVSTVLPCAAPRGDALYQAYERTVYQGDPYMTRDGSTIQVADYKSRYGQVLQSDAYQLATPIEQFDPVTGLMNVERPNPRALQVVASMDFYTTIGTGKVGGLMWAGTQLDAGYIDDATAGSLDRIPPTPSTLPWRVTPRAFTEGQLTNTSRGSVSIQFTTANLVNGVTGTVFVTLKRPDGASVTFTGSLVAGPGLFFGSNTLDLAASLVQEINANSTLSRVMMALALGDRVVIISKDVGSDGNGSTVSLGYSSTSGTGDSFGQVGITTTLTDAGATFVASDVGKTVHISGASSAVNNGNFVITAQTATTISWSNALGVAEVYGGSWGILFPFPFVPTNQAAQLLDGYGLGIYPSSNAHPVGAVVTAAPLAGGVNIPVNGGPGNSAISIGGMTERLPLGILVSDSDFISENPLGDNASAMRTYPGGIRPVYSNLPLTSGGTEYTRFLNDPGSLLSMSDGGVLLYTPYTSLTPSGTKKFRIYRGGGAQFVLSGTAPGGPVDWVSDSFPASLKPVLKGAALACKALLVRNFHEEAFSGAAPNRIRSEGDELQLVILTQAIYGNGNSQSEGVTLAGQISPTGYGEGYSASDRYLLEGRPMDRGRTRTHPDPALQPAPFFK